MITKKCLKIKNIYLLVTKEEIIKYDISKFKRTKKLQGEPILNNNLVLNNEPIKNNNQYDFPIQENHIDFFPDLLTLFDQEEGNSLNDDFTF